MDYSTLEIFVGRVESAGGVYEENVCMVFDFIPEQINISSNIITSVSLSSSLK